MRSRSLWPSVVLCLLIMLPLCGARLAAAQAEPPMGPIENLRARLASLEALIGPMRSLERQLRDGALVAVVRQTRVDYVEPAALRESLRLEVVRSLLKEGGGKEDPDSLGKAGDEAYIGSAVAALERDIAAESNAHLGKVARDMAWVEDRIRQLREELERLEAASRQQGSGAGAPVGTQGRWEPASQRVCPSPLFGKLLWSGSTPRCVSDDHTLFPGWRFGEKDEFVCAKCTPNCFFVETTGGRLICVVTGAPAAPGARASVDLSGTWRPERPGPATITLTGDPSGYDWIGTDGRYKHQGAIRGDGEKLEGALKDVPGFCCGREGYTWIEVVDANTFRERSVWWTPGQGSREKPQLTFGWNTWKRGAGGAAAAPTAPAAPEDLSAQKKALGDELNRVRLEGRWTADHHSQVGTFVGNAKTSAALDATERLMREYAACYATKNADTANIQEAARAGRYPTPGDRIGELDNVGAAFNGCMAAALSRWKGGAR